MSVPVNVAEAGLPFPRREQAEGGDSKAETSLGGRDDGLGTVCDEGGVRDDDHVVEDGIALTRVRSGPRPVQIKIAVDDLASSVRFYAEAFGLDYEVARRTHDHESSAFVFGEYGRDDFFLLWLLDDPGRRDRPGITNFSLLVDHVDRAHARALAAGATEVVPPHDAEGMPRSSGVRDPTGNWIGLAQR
jgi:predicted enzyme related to lactoylglutathione lyase